ncbi:MAG TPA: aconitate hydratase [Armatimonadetes bacterium]|nr:aconitate hydratase [Armatimonadota bacterium]
MGKGVARIIIESHLVEGEPINSAEIGIRIDQTLTQDATGTLAHLEFEAMGISRVRTKLSVSYVDHNMLQTTFENADDHRFLQSIAAKYGIYFSRPGNGICHQVHLERFAVPGETLLGSDSHTPTAGGIGMLAIGAGGLDVAVAMAGKPFYFTMPQIVLVKMMGRLPAWVSAKDVILELLRKLSVKGGIGKIFEYGGNGVMNLSVPERATITNMGAELGATTSIFPSDEQTLAFMRAQGREEHWRRIVADEDAEYDEVIELDLSQLEPLIACPSSPDNVVPVGELEGTPVHQVCIGSCTNSSYRDLMTVAHILKGKTVHPRVSATLTPGSRQVLLMLAQSGALTDIIAAGVRVLECACGPCIGMGQAPPTNAISLRTFNRNFKGRSGTQDDHVYLCSPEVAAIAAITGEITDPRKFGEPPQVQLPERFIVDDRLIIPPADCPNDVEVIRGSHIKSLPKFEPLPDTLTGLVLLKVGDNITTDHILPGGEKVLPLRSNLPAIAEFTFERIDPTFVQRIKAAGGGFVVGGENYGQGSSREHATLAPRYLGLRAVFAKSFARIHHANLVNFGVVPLEFQRMEDYESIEQGDELELPEIAQRLREHQPILVRNRTKGIEFMVAYSLTPRQVEILLAGGLLNWVKE